MVVLFLFCSFFGRYSSSGNDAINPTHGEGRGRKGKGRGGEGESCFPHLVAPQLVMRPEMEGGRAGKTREGWCSRSGKEEE